MSTVKVKKIRVTITVTDVDDVTKEHCTIEHDMTKGVTAMEYRNIQDRRQAEEWTEAVLRAALRNVNRSLAGESGVECHHIPKSMH